MELVYFVEYTPGIGSAFVGDPGDSGGSGIVNALIVGSGDSGGGGGGGGGERHTRLSSSVPFCFPVFSLKKKS